MFAVIKTGGKQYRVAGNDVIEVDRLEGTDGDAVAFGEVLMVGGEAGVTVGTPLVVGATVAGEIVGQKRTARILVFKKRRRQNSKRSRGHRQQVTVVRITEILTGGAAPSGRKAEARAKPKAKAEAKAEPKSAAPAAKAGGDDLKQLSGVGPAMEKKLHALGVKTFAQIAAWTTADAERIDEGINSKGRVEREDWIGQARKLLAGKKE
jgi:large subunit ribosomal protein L21